MFDGSTLSGHWENFYTLQYSNFPKERARSGKRKWAQCILPRDAPEKHQNEENELKKSDMKVKVSEWLCSLITLYPLIS